MTAKDSNPWVVAGNNPPLSFFFSMGMGMFGAKKEKKKRKKENDNKNWIFY